MCLCVGRTVHDRHHYTVPPFLGFLLHHIPPGTRGTEKMPDFLTIGNRVTYGYEVSGAY